MYAHQPIEKSFSDDERTVRELSTDTVVEALRWIHHSGQNFDHSGASVSSAFTPPSRIGTVGGNVSPTTTLSGLGESLFREEPQPMEQAKVLVPNKEQTHVPTIAPVPIQAQPSPSSSRQKVPNKVPPSNASRGNGKSAIAEEPEEKYLKSKQYNAMVATTGSPSTGQKSGGMSFEWTEHLIYIIIAIAIQLIFGHDYSFPDGIIRATGRACGVDVGEHNMNMCGLETTLEQAQWQLQFLTPIVLGGYVLMTVGLWMERRAAYLALCGAVRNINVNLASILPLSGSGDKFDIRNHLLSKRIRNARKTLARWSLLGYELSVLKARGRMEDETIAIPYLLNLGLLEKGEWNAMVPGDRHTSVWLWMQTKSVKLGQEGIISHAIHVQTLCQAVTLVRDRSNDLMSSLSRDLPFPFVSITGILVNCFLLLNALWKGVVWSIWLYEVGSDLYTTPKMYMDIIVLLMTSLLFGMLYDLSRILYNPFGDRIIDLPHAAMGSGVRNMARAFASGVSLPPNNYMNDASMEDDSKDDYNVFVGGGGVDQTMAAFRNAYNGQEPIDKMIPDQCGSLFAGISKRKSV